MSDESNGNGQGQGQSQQGQGHKAKQQNQQQGQQPSSQQAAASTPHDAGTTIIGADTHIKGELTFERKVKLDGRFEGQITGQGELHVTEEATCKADVDAEGVNVDGRIEGNLRVKQTVRLNDTAMIKGDIVASKMVMDEGASFFGQCAVGPEAVKGSDAPSGAAQVNGDQPAEAPPLPNAAAPSQPAAQPAGQAPAGGRGRLQRA